jgi:hypothetical protein
MKFAILATALAAASTVSSAAPSHEFAERAPSPWRPQARPGCQPWMWMICGVKAKRDTDTTTGASISGAADYYSQLVKTVKLSKDLAAAGSKPTAITPDGYTHEAFLYDFYGGDAKVPQGAKHNETSTPGCVVLGLCDI